MVVTWLGIVALCERFASLGDWVNVTTVALSLSLSFSLCLLGDLTRLSERVPEHALDHVHMFGALAPAHGCVLVALGVVVAYL